MSFSNKIVWLLFFLILSENGLSNDDFSGTPFVINYPRAEYEGGSQTWDIQQGANGMMYFANNNGLLEFDGVNWNVYNLPNNSNLRSIRSGSDGILYAGGYNEMGYYSLGESGGAVFTSFKHLVPEEFSNFGDVWKIFIHPDGVIFQTYTQLMLYNGNSIKVIESSSDFHFSFMINKEYYVNDMKNGLMRYAMGELFPLKGMEPLIGKEIWGILPLNNRLLIATASDGTYIYNGNSLQPIFDQSTDFLKKNQIYSTRLLENDRVVYGTIQNGILICDENGKPLKHLNMDDGLQNNTILCIAVDYLGNLWLGTDHGIDYIKVNSPLTRISNNYGLSSGYAATLKEDRLYLGTNQGLFTQKSDVFNSVLVDRKKMSLIDETKGQVWSLSDIDGTLFCGHNNGAFIIEGSDAKKISDIQGAWTFIQVPNLPNKIIGGTYTGLVLYGKEDGVWVFEKQLSGFSESSRQIDFDDDGTLWISHGYQGVYHLLFNNKYDSIIKVDFYNNNNSNIPEQFASLAKFDDKIMFLTSKGVLEYQEDKDDFFVNEEYTNIFGDEPIRAINRDVNQNIWYFNNTNVGVMRLGEDGKYVNISIPFKELEGSFIYSFDLVYPYDKRNVFFGTENGFVHYQPNFNKDYSYKFQSYLLSMRTANTDTIYYNNNAVKDNVILRYDNNSAEFAFSSNDFENSNTILYSTFLEGNDRQWSAWHTRSTRTYTNLYEGKYTFKVKAMNIYATVSEEKVMSFRVLPPFYRSVAAYTLYMLVVFIIILIIIYWVKKRFARARLRDEAHRQEVFRKKEERMQREGLVAEKEIIRMRNDKLREGIKQKDKELANSTMQMLHKNELLISLRDELKKLAELTGEDSNKHDVIRLVRGINKEIDNEKQWHVFETHFESVHEEFLNRIKSAYPQLTPRELKLCAYLRMNISSKEISVLMNISTRGVEISRYRLRKKLAITRETNLTDFILSF